MTNIFECQVDDEGNETFVLTNTNETFASLMRWAPPSPEPDLPMLRKLWDWVQEQYALSLKGKPSEWVQRVYMAEGSCGTVCCVAGKYILETRNISLEGCDTEEFRDLDDCDAMGSNIKTFFNEAQAGLGLTDYEARDLFNAGNSLDRVGIVLERIFERAGDKL